MNYNNGIILVAAASFFLFSCKENKQKEKNATAPIILRKGTATHTKNEKNLHPAPIINITDTIAPKENVIYIKDSAANGMRLTQKLGQIYGSKLQAVIKQNKLKMTGAPIAWYKSQKAPFFFEAGLPVDRKPAKAAKNVLFKIIGGDSVLVAHYYGPYESTGVAYEAMHDWLKEHHKQLTLPAYEIYVTDPIDKAGRPVDPFKVQTDIIFPHD